MRGSAALSSAFEVSRGQQRSYIFSSSQGKKGRGRKGTIGERNYKERARQNRHEELERASACEIDRD